MNEERYDGRTKKDDYKKYILIGASVILIIIIIKITFTIFTSKEPKADLNVLFAFNGALTSESKDLFSSALSSAVGYINGDGRTVVNIEYQKFDPSEYSEDGLNLLSLHFSQDDY